MSVFPLSPAQQRLWFLAQLEPENPLYNLSLVLRCVGLLNARALEQSLEAIVRRHESLRTSFTSVDGEPVQVVAPDVDVVLPMERLSDGSVDDRNAEILRRVRREAREPFDLARAPLLRARLLRLGEREHVLLLTLHHIVSDAAALDVLFEELVAFYGFYAEGGESRLSDPPPQYSHYAERQREWLTSEEAARQLAFWKARLAGLATLQLPTDRPPPQVRTFEGALQERRLSKEMTARLRSLSEGEGTTLFTTLLAVFQALLVRYSGQDDLVVGCPIANRSGDAERLVGFVANALVLRTDASGNPTFRELLQRVCDVVRAAYEHRLLPFETLVDELQPVRQLGRDPLFQVLFALHGPPRRQSALPGLVLRSSPLHGGTSTFDLSMHAHEEADGLRLEIEYSTDLFDAATIERMLGHFEALLGGVTTDPARRLSELPLLTERERHQLLVEWNDTAVDYPRDVCVHELFEAQAARTPEAEAVRFEGQALSYGELDRRANQLAHHLADLGVGPDVPVGIRLERSPKLVLGILGILKAGGAYVPLDPTYPVERQAYMLSDSRAPVLVSEQGRRGALPDSAGARVVDLDRDRRLLARRSVSSPGARAQPDDLAYVIYTSGSTGLPKGAMNQHRGICNRLQWMQDEFRLTKDDRVLHKAPVSFDVSVWELFWPLVSGACVVIARPGGHPDREYLVELIRAERVTTVHFVPSMLRVFLEAAGVEGCTSLRRVMSGGEALTPDLQERFFSRLDTELHNLYGPTEASVGVAAWRCRRGSASTTVPIGRPIANARIYVLDRHRQPVPVGVPGELYIGGVAVGRGYLGKPELTAERFIPDPFRPDHGARLYRTGDLARWLADGALAYLGRLDDQVKIRGYRIEPGEIEATLDQHPAVKESAVALHEDPSGTRRLTAWFAPRSRPAPSETDLHGYLKRRLPLYMLPARFVALDALPRTPSGKVDRRALPPPDAGSRGPAESFVAARTPLERILQTIWCDVLQIERVGIYDDFFELGGDSMLATKAISRIREALRVELPLHHLFETPTVDGLTATLSDLASDSETVPAKVERIQGSGKELRLGELSRLSEEEVNVLLDDLLARRSAKR